MLRCASPPVWRLLPVTLPPYTARFIYAVGTSALSRFAGNGLCTDRCGIDLHWWTDLGVPNDLASVVGCNIDPSAVRYTFLALAALTVPHMTLLFALQRMDARLATHRPSERPSEHAKRPLASASVEASHHVWVVRSYLSLWR